MNTAADPLTNLPDCVFPSHVYIPALLWLICGTKRELFATIFSGEAILLPFINQDTSMRELQVTINAASSGRVWATEFTASWWDCWLSSESTECGRCHSEMKANI